MASTHGRMAEATQTLQQDELKARLRFAVTMSALPEQFAQEIP
jgi:hypothetical protein